MHITNGIITRPNLKWDCNIAMQKGQLMVGRIIYSTEIYKFNTCWQVREHCFFEFLDQIGYWSFQSGLGKVKVDIKAQNPFRIKTTTQQAKFGCLKSNIFHLLLNTMKEEPAYQIPQMSSSWNFSDFAAGNKTWKVHFWNSRVIQLAKVTYWKHR